MKTDFLKDLGLTEEQINKIQAESGKDVQREKDKAQEIQKKLDDANTQITQLNETIKGTEGDAEKLKALQSKVDAYEKADKDRKAAEAEQQRKGAIRARFDALKGENKYLNEGTEMWMLSEFEKAVADKANEGKSDSDIFGVITKDKNIFVNPNQAFRTPPAGGGKTGDAVAYMQNKYGNNPWLK